MSINEIMLYLFAVVGMACVTVLWLYLIHIVESMNVRKVKRALKCLLVRGRRVNVRL